MAFLMPNMKKTKKTWVSRKGRLLFDLSPSQSPVGEGRVGEKKSAQRIAQQQRLLGVLSGGTGS